MKLWVSNNCPSSHFVESNILCRQSGSRSDHHAVRNALGQRNGPTEGLHSTERPTHHCSKPFNSKPIGHARLRAHPILYGQDRKRSPPRLASFGTNGGRACRAKARAEIINANYKKYIGIHGLARANHVVPPPNIFRIFGGATCDMMRGVQCMTHQHSVTGLSIERTVSFNRQLVRIDRMPTTQGQRLVK